MKSPLATLTRSSIQTEMLQKSTDYLRINAEMGRNTGSTSVCTDDGLGPRLIFELEAVGHMGRKKNTKSKTGLCF